MIQVNQDHIRLFARLLARDAAGVRRLQEAHSVPLDQLALIADGRGLSVVLLGALEHLNLAAELSEGSREKLQARLHRQETRNKALMSALTDLSDRFEAASLPVILLKGPYFAEKFYGSILGREYVDLDLLVPPADRMRAFKVLEEAGFSHRSRVLISESLTTYFVHGYDFISGAANLDLHWRLSKHPSLSLDEAQIWAKRGSYVVGGRTYAVLSAEHDVIFAVLSFLRDMERNSPKIKCLLEIVKVVSSLDASVEWEELLGLGCGTLGPLVNVLSLCLDIADAHDLAPKLSSALERHLHRRVSVRSAATPLTFEPTWLGFGNKRWAALTYDCAVATWLAWWLVSVPFRRAVHGWPRPRILPPTRRS